MKQRSRRRAAPAAKRHPYADLSFVKAISPRKHPKGFGRCCWSVARSGNYTADCHIGSAYADELVAFLREHPEERRNVLRDILADMVLGGRLDGVEVGFLRKINWYFVAGAGVRLPRGDCGALDAA